MNLLVVIDFTFASFDSSATEPPRTYLTLPELDIHDWPCPWAFSGFILEMFSLQLPEPEPDDRSHLPAVEQLRVWQAEAGFEPDGAAEVLDLLVLEGSAAGGGRSRG